MPTRSSSREKVIERKKLKTTLRREVSQTWNPRCPADPQGLLLAIHQTMEAFDRIPQKKDFVEMTPSWKARIPPCGTLTSHNGLDTASRNPHSHKGDDDLFKWFINLKNEEPKNRIKDWVDDVKQDVLNITDRMPYPG
jgi:hypothetical protein